MSTSPEDDKVSSRLLESASVTQTPTRSRYRSLRRLAAGGMGEVELAIRREGKFQRLYAVKRLLPELRNDDDARMMFVDEARVSGLIRHPNVVSVLDVGEDERGPFLVMDFVEGLSAGMLLKWACRAGVMLPLQLCLRMVREVAVGLHAAHELCDHKGEHLQVVHRDVSPQNILIGFDGISRIADFGIAKAGGRTTKTTTGLLKGKAGYMAPEQLRFEEPDRRTDIFSLGVVLYELLASARLYKSETDVIAARRILNEAPPDIDDVRDDVPPAVVDLLFRSLSKDPDVRPASAQEFAATLESALAALVELDGALDVGDYMRLHFQERHQAIRELAVEAKTDLTLQPPVLLATPAAPHPSSAPSRRLLLASALGLVLVGALAGLALNFGGDSNEEASNIVRAASDVPPVPPAGRVTEVAPVQVRAVEEPAESEPTETQDPAPRPTTRRRSPVRSPMSTTDVGMSTAGMSTEAALFDWQEP